MTMPTPIEDGGIVSLAHDIDPFCGQNGRS